MTSHHEFRGRKEHRQRKDASPTGPVLRVPRMFPSPLVSKQVQRLFVSRPVQRSFSVVSSSHAYRRFGDPPRRPAGGLQLPPTHQRNTAPQPLFSSARAQSLPFLSRLRRPPIFVFVILGGSAVYYVAHLEKVEATGRWRFIDVSDSQEDQMGKQALAEVMGEFGGRILPASHPASRQVQAVVKRIVNANKLEAGSDGWRTFVVADDKTKNAFVVPGGQVFVFTGILDVAKDEHGLAVILGHEIAHQVARHSAERMSSLKVLMGLSLLLESFGIDAGLSRILLNFLMTLPNSRKNESEADYIGLQLATKACFDPRAARGLWQRMDGEGGAGNIDFMSTHPSSAKRVDKVTAWAEEIIRDRPDSCGPLRQQAGAFQNATGARW